MRQIGPYKLVRVLGAGGMGRVFQAIDSKTGQTVALKVIKGPSAADEAARMRFVQEARAARQLQHPNIVNTLDFGQARGALYIAMEYLQGLPLSSFIPGPPVLSLRRKLSIMEQCAGALAYAHSRGVIHRDVKPANMILVDGRSVKLVDFGLAEITTLPNAKVRGGTPPYMSPEQVLPRDVDGRTDIWSAGVALFELLTGRLPYRNWVEIVEGPAPKLPWDFPFAADLNAVLARALARDREMRYANAEQLAADLRAIRQRCEEAARADAASVHGSSHPAAGAPSSDETVALEPVMLVAGEAAVSPPHISARQPSPANQPALAPSPGKYELPELGFQRAAEGVLQTSTGRFGWNERTEAVRALRHAIWSKWLTRLLLALAAIGAVGVGVLACLPRLSPDARQELAGLGFLALLVAYILLPSLAWLALTVLMSICPAFGVAEHLPQCQSCRLRMRRTRFWTRICSSREEVFFGYRDCMAALKRRLWQDAANLLAMYGEEHLSKYRERFMSPSVRYHITFFECATCGHHAARLTAEEMIERRWEEQARFEEAYWGGGAATSRTPPFARFASWLRLGLDALKNLHPLDLPLVTAGGVVMALSFWAWIIYSGAGQPPLSRGISRVAWSASGKWLAAATPQGRIAIWDMASAGVPRQLAFSEGAVNDLQFSPDGRALAIASRNLGLYATDEAASPRLLRTGNRNYRSARFSRDGRTLVVVTRAGIIETVDVHSGARRFQVCCSAIFGEAGEAVFMPSGEAIVHTGKWPSLWNARSGQFLGRLVSKQEQGVLTCGSIAFGRYGTMLLGCDHGVYAWEREKKRLLPVAPTPLAVSQAGLGVPMRNPDTGTRCTSNLVLSSDCATIAFGTASGEIVLWNIAKARRIRTMKMPEK